MGNEEGELLKRIIERKWIVQDATDILKDIDEAKKALDSAKTYEELKSTIKRWFGE